MPSSVTVNDDGTTTLEGTATFTVAGAGAIQTVSYSTTILPAFVPPDGKGRLVHPMLGALDYAAKPDEWVNLLDDVVIPPVWAVTKTLGGSLHSLWPGYLRDVVVEERWKSLGGLAMPIGQLRMLVNMWMNPPNPETEGYVSWFPNYATGASFSVIVLGVKAGDGITLDDVIHSKDAYGENDGWVTAQVTVTMKIVERL